MSLTAIDRVIEAHREQESAQREQESARRRLLASVAQAVEQGVPQTELADRLGCTRVTIYRWLREERSG